MTDPERGDLEARNRQLVLRPGGPAFTQLSDDQLRSAIALAERILTEGDPLLRRLSEQSLRWRGK